MPPTGSGAGPANIARTDEATPTTSVVERAE